MEHKKNSHSFRRFFYLLNSLEKHKKSFSSIFFLISAILLLPFILLVKQNFIQTTLTVVLAIHLFISCIYFFKGVSWFVMSIAYYLILVLVIILGLLMQCFLPLPSFLDKEVFNSVSIALFVFLTIVLRIPQHAREFIDNRVQDLTPLLSLDDLYQKSFGVDGLKEAPVNYNTYIEYNNGLNNAEKPYSLANAPRVLRCFRITLSIVIYISSFIGIIIGINSWDNAASFITSWVFWLVIISLTGLFTSSILLIYGIIRFLISILASVILVVVSYFVSQLLIRMKQISISLFIILLICILLLLILSFYRFIRYISKEPNRTLTYYDKDDIIVGTNLVLYDLCPILDYTKLAIAQIHFKEKDVPDIFESFSDDVAFFCKNNKIIIAGIRFDLNTRVFLIYLYCESNKQIKAIDRFLNKHLIRPYQITLTNDQHWNTYKTELYPDIISLIKLKNEQIIETLEEQKFDFIQPHPMIFTVQFEDKDNALSFKTAAIEHGYDKAVYIDNSGVAKELNLIKKYFNQVYVQKTFRISPEWLNIETLKLNSLAQDYNGDYDFIQLGEIDEEFLESLFDGSQLNEI